MTYEGLYFVSFWQMYKCCGGTTFLHTMTWFSDTWRQTTSKGKSYQFHNRYTNTSIADYICVRRPEASELSTTSGLQCINTGVTLSSQGATTGWRNCNSLGCVIHIIEFATTFELYWELKKKQSIKTGSINNFRTLFKTYANLQSIHWVAVGLIILLPNSIYDSVHGVQEFRAFHKYPNDQGNL